MTFYLNGHQNYQKSKLKIPKSLLLLSKVKNLNPQIVAVLMLLEIKHHTVPHLKALTHSIKHASRHGLAVLLNSVSLC